MITSHGRSACVPHPCHSSSIRKGIVWTRSNLNARTGLSWGSGCGSPCNAALGVGRRNARIGPQVRASAAPAAQTAKAWWKEYSHLWQEIKSRDQFDEVVTDSNYELVLVGALQSRSMGLLRR
jgi:hypothetical protein